MKNNHSHHATPNRTFFVYLGFAGLALLFSSVLLDISGYGASIVCDLMSIIGMLSFAVAIAWKKPIRRKTPRFRSSTKDHTTTKTDDESSRHRTRQ